MAVPEGPDSHDASIRHDGDLPRVREHGDTRYEGMVVIR